MRRWDPPHEVRAIRNALTALLDTPDPTGRPVGNSKHGAYAFFDYDGEPIYVGQTKEKLRTRVRRHLTNQRTDAVAMNVLDVFEVAEVELWPLWDLENASPKDVTQALNSAEYTVFQQVLRGSIFGAVLNEVPVAEAPVIELPSSVRGRIVPNGIYDRRKHADIRIARRASTIAKLALVISERKVKPGLRATLLTQARRLEHLARQRLEHPED